ASRVPYSDLRHTSPKAAVDAAHIAVAAVHGMDFLLNLELRAHRQRRHFQSRSECLQAARFRVSGHLHAGRTVLGCRKIILWMKSGAYARNRPSSTPLT